MAPVAQHADEPPAKLPPALAVTFALLGLAGNADAREFIATAVKPAGEPRAERAGRALVHFAFAIERDGRDQKTI